MKLQMCLARHALPFYGVESAWTQGRGNRSNCIMSNSPHAAAEWFGRYATSRKVAGSRPDEVKDLSSIYLPAALGPGVYSVANRN
jgi:hypothetical protein